MRILTDADKIDCVLLLTSREAQDLKYDLKHLKNGLPWREKHERIDTISPVENLLRHLGSL